MSFPKGAVWQDLRALALDAVPSGSRVIYGRNIGLRDWRETGAYTVSNMSSTRITVVASSDEFGSALLSDVEHFLNHAIEQQGSIWKVLQSGAWFSPAWMTVSFYYWAYFLALAISRLVGRSAAWVDSDSLKAIKRLAPSANPSPGPGTFKTITGAMLSATMREIEILKDKKKAHAAVWALFFDLVQSLAASHQCARGTSMEDRLFAALKRSSERLGTDWPSELRNFVNYRPGFAYDTVMHVGSLGTFSFVKIAEANTIDEVVGRFENAMESAIAGPGMLVSVRPFISLLVELTFLLHSAANDMYDELKQRYSLDNRWAHQRRRFLRDRGLILPNGLWPC